MQRSSSSAESGSDLKLQGFVFAQKEEKLQSLQPRSPANCLLMAFIIDPGAYLGKQDRMEPGKWICSHKTSLECTSIEPGEDWLVPQACQVE